MYLKGEATQTSVNTESRVVKANASKLLLLISAIYVGVVQCITSPSLKLSHKLNVVLLCPEALPSKRMEDWQCI